MAFIDFIERLQQKPEATRKKIMAGTIFVLMAIIISLWAFTLSYTLPLQGEGKKLSDTEDPSLSPLAMLKKNIEDGVKNLYSQFSK